MRCPHIARLFVVVSLPSAAFAQSDSARADSAFRARDWRTSAALYERLAAASASGMAQFRLGASRHALNELDAAVAAYERALALGFQPAFTLLRLARVHALKGDVSRSLRFLDSLVPLRAVPLAILDTITDLAIVRRDARYAGIVERMNALRYPCRTMPEAHQLDFWIGDWDVVPWSAPPGPGAQLLGTNRIEAILEHCVLMEHWTSANGGFGKSMNFYDTNVQRWRQVWMADGGGSLDYTGEFRDGAMRFEGWTLAPDGRSRILQKLTFVPVHRDTVRQLFETSADSGRTWQPGFDGRYVRRPPSGRPRP